RRGGSRRPSRRSEFDGRPSPRGHSVRRCFRIFRRIPSRSSLWAEALPGLPGKRLERTRRWVPLGAATEKLRIDRTPARSVRPVRAVLDPLLGLCDAKADEAETHRDRQGSGSFRRRHHGDHSRARRARRRRDPRAARSQGPRRALAARARSSGSLGRRPRREATLGSPRLGIARTTQAWRCDREPGTAQLVLIAAAPSGTCQRRTKAERFATAEIKSSGLTGLPTWVVKPAASALVLSSARVYAVSAIDGIPPPCDGASARARVMKE